MPTGISRISRGWRARPTGIASPLRTRRLWSTRFGLKDRSVPDRRAPTVLSAPDEPADVDARRILGALAESVPDDSPTLLDCPAGRRPTPQRRSGSPIGVSSRRPFGGPRYETPRRPRPSRVGWTVSRSASLPFEPSRFRQESVTCSAVRFLDGSRRPRQSRWRRLRYDRRTTTLLVDLSTNTVRIGGGSRDPRTSFEPVRTARTTETTQTGASGMNAGAASRRAIVTHRQSQTSGAGSACMETLPTGISVLDREFGGGSRAAVSSC